MQKRQKCKKKAELQKGQEKHVQFQKSCKTIMQKCKKGQKCTFNYEIHKKGENE